MAQSLSRRAGRAAAAVVISAVTIGAGTSASKAELVYAVTMQNFLTSFDSATPTTLNGGVQITGLGSGELIMGMDFRPSTGVLYGMGSQNHLYTINTTTGVATAVGGTFAPPASGVEFGMGFNGATDTIRIVSDANQNFRLSPTTGLVVGTDTALAYATGDANFGQDPSVMAAGYDNAGAPTLWALDSRFNSLVRIGSVGGSPNSPNGGQMTTIGAAGVDFVEMGGLDFGATGTAYAALLASNSSASSLYTINLTTGAATAVGQIGGGLFIRDIAVVPGPGSLAVLGGGLLIVGRRRR